MKENPDKKKFIIQGQNWRQDQFHHLTDQKDLLFSFPVISLLLHPVYFDL